jgi:hypothetical protein
MELGSSRESAVREGNRPITLALSVTEVRHTPSRIRVTRDAVPMEIREAIDGLAEKETAGKFGE